MSTESWLLNMDDAGITKAQTSGAFQLPRVYPGDYSVRFTVPPAYYVVDAMQQSQSVRNGGLKIGNGDVRVVLGMDGANVSGRVLWADDSPVPDAAVVLARDDANRPLLTHTDQNGAYRFTAGVRPGRHHIAAPQELFESQEQDGATLGRVAANGTALELNPRETKTLDLRVTPRH